jgi:adenylate cyclase
VTEPLTEPRPDIGQNEEGWREYLTGFNSREARYRRLFKMLPTDPRCELCAAPFAGAAAPVMRAMGKYRSQRNPKWCNACFAYIEKHRGGAEITASMLFADIRGSTTMAERMSPAEFRALLDRFYDVASQTVFDHDGLVDKFVGDELVAQFYPLIAGERHVARAVEAARALMRATGHGGAADPWVPVGAGVHVGNVWIGTVGTGSRVELTMVGDAVNVTARLAGAAGTGEILVSADAAIEAGLARSLPREQMELKGKSEQIEVVRLAALQ